MSEPFIAEIRMLPYSYAPKYWAYCDGGLMDINQNTALFALIGTTYGGNGRTTMGLPNLQGRAPLHQGHGPGLSYYRLGQMGGNPGIPLHINNLPAHKHTAYAVRKASDSDDPTDRLLSQDKDNNTYKTEPDPSNHVPMSISALSQSGGGKDHENRQPFLCVPFCIALQGIFPSRN